MTAEGSVPQVIADPDSLHSALTNLIINGLQAMDGSGGRIAVALSGEDEGRCVRIDVTDTGRGIAAEDISKVFEPYYATKETGTGLGLAIAERVIRVHGGTIRDQNVTPKGLQVEMLLPELSQNSTNPSSTA